MKKLEYKELKKENIKDLFDKVYFEEKYILIIRDGLRNYFFQGCGNCDDGIRRIRERDIPSDDYDYDEFEEIFYNGIYMFFDKFIIDEEEKFIVVI